MSELKHTPGPWKLGLNGPMDIESQEDGDLIATVWLSDVEYDAANANLALILAAPELLEALISIQQLLFIWNAMLPVEKADTELQRKVDAAIAKATQKIYAP